MTVVSLVSEVFYPVLPGGMAQFFRYGPGLLERGVRLRVHTTLTPEHGDEQDLEVNGIEIRRHRLPAGLDHQTERVRLLRLALAAMRRDGRGLAHRLQPNGDSWRSNALLWRARLGGVPSTCYFTMFPDPPPARLDRRLRYLLRLRALQAPYARLVVCSHRMKAAYEQITGRRTRRMMVLPNGVDLARFAPATDRAAARGKLGLPPGVPLVLYCGSVTPRKGTDVLLDAWDRLAAAVPEALLVICGSVGMRPTFREPAMRAELAGFTRDVERRLAGNGSVVLAGEVERVEDYYQAADVFVFPSRREGLPNAVLEAMATGLPCVVAPFAGVPGEGEEFGHDGRQFVRSSHDPDQLAADLLRLIHSPEQRAAIGAAARAWMERTQRMEATLDLLAGIYAGAGPHKR